MDKLFQNTLEESARGRQKELEELARLHAARGSLKGGAYLTAHADVLLKHIRLLGEARASSLLRAYEKSGLLFDDPALQEVTSEVIGFCHSQQHSAIGSIGQTIAKILGVQGAPPNIHTAVANRIIQGVDGIMARLARDLSIRRDEMALDERRVRRVYAAGLGKHWDVFVCHASEDKDEFVRPLAAALQESGLSVWFDEFTLKVGDSLRRKIDEGLANSRYGIVVLSKNFFAKNWPQHELDGLVSREIAGTKVILPVWHKISLEEVRGNSPMLSGLVAAKSDEGVATVIFKLREAMGL